MTDDSPDLPTGRDEVGDTVRDSLEAVLADDEFTDRLDHLHRIASQFGDQLTETATYDHAIVGAYDLFDISYAVIVIPQGDQWVTITSTRSNPNDQYGQAPIVNAEIEAALDRNETVLIEDASKATDNVVPFENGCALCSPIGDVGILQLVRDDGDFDEADDRYAKLLGRITAMHLDHLTLHDEIESMEAQLASFADFEGDIFEQTSHDLRTPLTTIIGYTELLDDELVGPLSDEQRKFTRLVLRKATELDATIETLTSSFDTRLANVRAGRRSLSETSWVADSESDHGPFVFLSLDTELSTPLANQLTDLGYEVTVTDDPETARAAVRRSPSSTIVVELFAASSGDDNGSEGSVNGYENGLRLAEEIRREEGTEETTIRVASIFRDDSVPVTQLGVSAYVSDRADVIGEAAELLLGVGAEEPLSVLVFDVTAAENSIGELPANWNVTTVDGIDAARIASQTALYDLAVVRTETLSEREHEIVQTLRERRHGRKLPVVLVDSGPTVTDARYVLGGKLFVQRPIAVANLTSILVSAQTENDSGSTDRRDNGGSTDR